MARKTATGDEAAAVAAAIAWFEAEGTEAEPPLDINQWRRAALIEGVSAKQTLQDLQGGARWLS